MIYVASIQYFDTADSTVKTLYVATEGFATKPSDTPANTVIEGRVVNPALIRRDVFDVGTTGGASRVGYGELVLQNSDGALDDFLTWALDGRSLVVRYASSVTAAFPSGYTTLFTGTMEQAEVSSDTVRIRIRDKQVFATQPFQPYKYGGTNALPAGLDGLETDLKGKAKPRVLGGVYNASPLQVNTSLLVFQVHDGTNFGPLRDIMAVYDSGVLLTREPDYASEAALLATAPGAGAYRAYPTGGLFRLGSSPVGEVTCDAVQGLSPVNRTAAALFRSVLLDAGLSSGEISAADLTALDTANSATLGLYVRDETTNQEILDAITRSVGAWWASDVTGVIRVQRLEEPTGTPVLSLVGADIEKLERIPLNENGLPIYRATVRGIPNYTVQTSGLAGSVSAARRARLALPFQDGIATDATVQTAYLLAPEFAVETKLSCLGAVQAEAARLLALYSVKRDRFEVVINADATTLAAIDLGVVIQITYSRFNLSGGRLFRVLGYRLDPTRSRAELTVWG